MDAHSGPQIPPRQLQTWQRYQQLGRWFDGLVRIPGTPIRFGLDALLGLVPIAGDAVGALFTAYGIWLARRMGAPGVLQLRMLGNLALDTLGGAIPLVGDVFDIAFRAHARNRKLMERWLAEPHRTTRRSQLAAFGIGLALLLLLALTIAIGVVSLNYLLGLVSRSM